VANIYIYSGAGGAGTGADWTNAYTSLSAALGAGSAGDDFWVADDHVGAAGAATINLVSPGTVAAPCRIFCVNRAGSVPPVAADLLTTATVSCTGTNQIVFTGHAYCYGIQFSAGSTTSIPGLRFAGDGEWVLESCKLILAGSNALARIYFGGTTNAASNATTLINTTMKFAAVGQLVTTYGTKGAGQLIWRDTASAIDAAGSIPTTLFSPDNTLLLDVRNVDLSALSSGKTIVAAITGDSQMRFERCKLDGSVTKYATPTSFGATIQFINCSSSATAYEFEKANYYGTQTVETTIVRTGSEATDGVTPISYKLVSTANAKHAHPFAAPPIARFNTSTSSITVNVYGIWGGGSVPNNDDIWMDVEYQNDAGTPLGSVATSGRASQLAAASAIASDTSTWGGSTTKFKMSVTFTPDRAGTITVRIYVGAASGTFYIDPAPEISGQAISTAFAA
jgi:hypothetical protein